MTDLRPLARVTWPAGFLRASRPLPPGPTGLRLRPRGVDGGPLDAFEPLERPGLVDAAPLSGAGRVRPARPHPGRRGDRRGARRDAGGRPRRPAGQRVVLAGGGPLAPALGPRPAPGRALAPVRARRRPHAVRRPSPATGHPPAVPPLARGAGRGAGGAGGLARPQRSRDAAAPPGSARRRGRSAWTSAPRVVSWRQGLGGQGGAGHRIVEVRPGSEPLLGLVGSDSTFRWWLRSLQDGAVVDEVEVRRAPITHVALADVCSGPDREPVLALRDGRVLALGPADPQIALLLRDFLQEESRELPGAE